MATAQGTEQLGILGEYSRQNLQIMQVFLLALQHTVRKKLFTGIRAGRQTSRDLHALFSHLAKL